MSKQRELKFRVWNGLEMVYDVMVGKFGTFYVNPSNNGIDERDSASLTPMNTKYPDGTPVMQFTGLYDKHGKEIWEGDIVNAHEVIGTVKWSNELALFELAVMEGGDPGSMTLYSSRRDQKNIHREVIGNIYSNPELVSLSTNQE